ncbi:DUF418 domain-containing protein [Paenibacillus daejeonensis]|uniref:DUF418 domain-containing protein n=1 Tax=Paenibacillus daejeonensis TaxID=135193 RepID=UPI000382EEEE|nr:DUF418 domain-containing protein [Paenibacillus daejeonensis]
MTPEGLTTTKTTVPSARIRLLDVLRGFAILGTLGTNIWIFAYLGDLNYLFTFQNNDWWNNPETLVRLVFLALVNGKFLGLLAMMFGAGLELKYQQSLRKGRRWPGMYLWTAGLLMLEGFIHYTLVMEFDILMGYAAAAVIVAYLVKAGERAMRRTLYWLGGAYALVVLLVLLAVGFAAITGAALMGDMSSIVTLYAEATWVEQVQYRLTHLLELRLEVIIALPLNVCLFLIGILLMRAGAFSPGEKGRRLRGKMMRIGLFIGLPLNLLLLVPGGVFDLPSRYLFAPLLSVGYLGIIGWLLERYAQASLWNSLERVGRMSLSCYVGQNLLCAWLFYGWGLGLGGTLNAYQVVGLWAILGVLQIAFAMIWLRFFRNGPMEAARRFLSPRA